MDEFNRALLEAVDEGLLALGESVRQAIYWHLENKYFIKREEIPDKPEKFNEALKTMIGEGANVLLKLMVKRLYNKLGLNFEEKPNWSFKDYVEYAKKNIKIT